MISFQEPLILVYYSFRGLAQPIRSVLCYLDLPYAQIHLDHFEQQSQQQLPHILEHYKKFKINKNELPALIHGSTIIENVYPIIIYIVKKFERTDLLGSSIQTRSRVKEIMEIYFSQQHIVYDVLKLAQFSSKHSIQQINTRCKNMFEELMNNSRYIRQVSQYLDRQQHPVFVFKELTLIDFFYFETCQYILGIFDKQQRVYQELLNDWDSQSCSFLDKPNAYYIKIMKIFEAAMKSQPCYQNHSIFLDSFSMKCPLFNEVKAQGLKKIWLGNMTWIT